MAEHIESVEPAEGLSAPSAEPAAAETEATDQAVAAKKPGWVSVAYEIAETVVLAVVIWAIVNFVTARFIVEGSSMEPNFHTGQMLIVNRLAYSFGPPQRGDVVVFLFPGNQTDDYIKRIIGVPGDQVVIDAGGAVYVNGARLVEPYINTDPLGGLAIRPGRWDVKPDSYFVMGDNRSHSSDSRSWGLLPAKDIIGKAIISYWPPGLWGIVKQFRFKNVPSVPVSP